MRAFRSLALAVAAASLLPADGALANGGDLHFGASSTGIPVAVVAGFALFVGLAVVFFVANWARYRRARSSEVSPPGSGEPLGREKEEDHDVR